MTDKLLSLAREVGAEMGAWPEPTDVLWVKFHSVAALTAFAERIRQDERERCAKLCEAERVDAEESGASEDRAYNWAVKHCASAIRSRGTSGRKSDE